MSIDANPHTQRHAPVALRRAPSRPAEPSDEREAREVVSAAAKLSDQWRTPSNVGEVAFSSLGHLAMEKIRRANLRSATHDYTPDSGSRSPPVERTCAPTSLVMTDHRYLIISLSVLSSE